MTSDVRLTYVSLGEPRAFVARDIEILEELYDVRTCVYGGAGDAWRVRSAVRDADVVMSWFADWHSAFATFFARRADVPVAAVVGGYDTAIEPEIDFGIFHHGPWFHKRVVRYVHEHADIVLPVTEHVAGEVRRVASPKRMRVVYNGVRVEDFTPGDAPREPLVLTVAFLNEESIRNKGIRTFMEVAERVEDARFLVVGSLGDDAAREVAAGAPSNVEFTGFVPDEELQGLFRRASVYCQLSWHEGFGIAVAEGMASGCIPVVADRTAMPEVVGDAGLVVPHGDVDAAAEAVERALGMGEEAREEARARVAERFTLERRQRELEDVVEELVGRMGGPGGRG